MGKRKTWAVTTGLTTGWLTLATLNSPWVPVAIPEQLNTTMSSLLASLTAAAIITKLTRNVALYLALRLGRHIERTAPRETIRRVA